MKTKDRIVNAAVELFNDRGIHDVSIRDIAGTIGISPGNFAYHFKNKEALLDYFYAHLYDEVDIPVKLKEEEGFAEFQNILERITQFIERYRFFYTDIVDLFRMCPAIQEDYANNYEGRKAIYHGFLQHFVHKGLINPPDDPKVFDDLTHSIWFTMTFWQSQKKVLPAGARELQADFVMHQVWQLIAPYMTDAGHEAYGQLT